MGLVSFYNYTPPERYDNKPWMLIIIEESSTNNGPWTQIDSISIDPLDHDPSQPDTRDFSTENASLAPGQGWYRITWKDNDGDIIITDPLFNPISTEILASTQDVNVQLPNAFQAGNNDLAGIQLSVARIVRGYLSRVIDNSILLSWATPETTPDLIREAAAKLIAAQYYFNETAQTSVNIEPTSFAQEMYTQGMAILNDVIMGIVNIPNLVIEPVEGLLATDFFPVDATDRAFTMSQPF